MTYKFSYKLYGLLFKSVTVLGHGYNKELDRMTLYLPNGGIKEIANWSAHDCMLGSDWVLAMKKEMEAKSGQPIVIDRDVNAN